MANTAAVLPRAANLASNNSSGIPTTGQQRKTSSSSFIFQQDFGSHTIARPKKRKAKKIRDKEPSTKVARKNGKGASSRLAIGSQHKYDDCA